MELPGSVARTAQCLAATVIRIARAAPYGFIVRLVFALESYRSTFPEDIVGRIT
jgi:hypothetical protein